MTFIVYLLSSYWTKCFFGWRE